MGVIIENFEKPSVCLECPFRSKTEELYEGKGIYRKIAYCTLYPNMGDGKDIYREIYYFSNHIEKWCPIKEIKSEKE